MLAREQAAVENIRVQLGSSFKRLSSEEVLEDLLAEAIGLPSSCEAVVPEVLVTAIPRQHPAHLRPSVGTWTRRLPRWGRPHSPTAISKSVSALLVDGFGVECVASCKTPSDFDVCEKD